MAKKRRYKLLDVVRRWYMFLGLITCLIGTIVAGLMIYNSGGETFGLVMGLVYFVGSIITGITLAAIGEGIELAMDLEDNTRQTHELSLTLRQQLADLNGHGNELRDTTKQCQAWLARIGRSTAPKASSETPPRPDTTSHAPQVIDMRSGQ